MEKVHKTYKFRIYPTKAQVRIFGHTLDLCRELYNAALQERRDAWKLNRIKISYLDQQNQIKEIRQIREDLAAIYSHILRTPLRNLENAFEAFFQRIKSGKKFGFPRFKAKQNFNSFTYPENRGFKIENNFLNLSKIGRIKIEASRKISGKLKNCTISRNSNGKWFASFACEVSKEVLAPINQYVGLDVGLTHFATLSNGETISNPRFFKTDEKELAKAQRKLSKEGKSSKEFKKRKKVVARIYERITNRRNNFAHQISRDLVNNFDRIFFEDLNIKGMMKNHCLAKAIGDVAWKQLIEFTLYKAESADRIVRLVNPKNTSQNCSNCGEKVEKTLAVKIHDCHKCGLKIDRDLNAAKNILTLGLQSLV